MHMASYEKNVFATDSNRAIQIIELILRYSVSLREKAVCDILFTFDKLGILKQFSFYHMPYVFHNA